VDVHFGPPIQAAAGEAGHDVMARVMAYFESLGAEPRNGRSAAAANGNGSAAARRSRREPVAPSA
jgi:hypothetical protein